VCTSPIGHNKQFNQFNGPKNTKPITIFSFLFLVLLSVLSRSTTAAAASSSSSPNHHHRHLRYRQRIIMSSAITSWPELVGMTGDQAENSLRADHPDWTIQVIPNGSMVTMDYREDRVRIFVDDDGKVVNPPRVG
jgi:hypothetical protein